MLIEIPELRRCCCCLPLRRGILIFGYISLFLTILFGTLQIVLCVFYHNMKSSFATTAALYRGVIMEVQLCIVFLLYSLDIVFHIVLIVGAHMKRRRLLRIYYYYELTTMVATFVVVLITYIDLHRYPRWNFILTEFSLAFTGFVLQVYLVLLVRSELNKDRYQEGTSSFINHVAEVFIDPPLRRQWRTDL
ncbi:uncharacterized protein LOC111356650 [Spodoptera litura]|uniref:Uncharacterized protein LOC111356650 n=1 Tax=Spodoptera litura TaxID=69820 RepID=A0A9J7E9G9_SPOLT|nr:uncharacterized protein LOC111356650 [Spodoptera litura]